MADKKTCSPIAEKSPYGRPKDKRGEECGREEEEGEEGKGSEGKRVAERYQGGIEVGGKGER